MIFPPPRKPRVQSPLSNASSPPTHEKQTLLYSNERSFHRPAHDPHLHLSGCFGLRRYACRHTIPQLSCPGSSTLPPAPASRMVPERQTLLSRIQSPAFFLPAFSEDAWHLCHRSRYHPSCLFRFPHPARNPALRCP